MSCGGFSCSRNVLALLNMLYIVVAFVLIGVAAYAKAVAIIATVHVMGGIIGCGVFLLLIAIIGLIGAVKHHQVLLFFYMIILFLLFLVQFAVACACLALSDAQQADLFRVGWKSSTPEVKHRAQTFFECCGYTSETQNLNISDPLGHPSCEDLSACKTEPLAICCQSMNRSDNESSISDCPVKSCQYIIEPILHQAVKVVGGLGLFFSFTELMAVWYTVRYRNQKDPQISPSIFL